VAVDREGLEKPVEHAEGFREDPMGLDPSIAGRRVQEKAVSGRRVQEKRPVSEHLPVKGWFWRGVSIAHPHTPISIALQATDF